MTGISTTDPASNCNNNNNNTRWLILFLSCMAMTGVYYSFDIPAALHQQLKDIMTSNPSSTISTISHDDDDESSFSIKFNLLYSVYSIPNIFLPFLGGSLVDSLGAHSAALIFASLTLCGQFLFALGTSHRDWNLMFMGRTLYGFGGESISVATSTLNHEWFRGKELALSFGINLAVSRLGSVVNDFLSPRVANEYGVDVAVWLGVGMNCMSVCMMLGICGLTLLDRNTRSGGGGSGGGGGRERVVGEGDLTEPLLSRINHSNHDNGDNDDDENDETHGNHDDCHDGGEDGGEGDDNGETNTETETNTIMACHTTPMEIGPVNDNNANDILSLDHPGQDEHLSSAQDNALLSPNHTCMGHILQFDKMFWILCLSCVVVYGCVLPFNNVASGILLERNYFIDPPLECHLQYETMCSMGDLAPREGNIAMDTNGNVCVLTKYMRPILPSSIRIYASDVNDNDTISVDDWIHDSYVFDHLTENDLDCGDAFWRNACTADFCKAQKVATEQSGRVMSIPYLFSAFLSPLFGHFVDRIGKRAILAVVSCVLLVAVHLSLAWSRSSPVVPLVGQGLAYVGYAAVIWPSVPLTVRKESVGTAFGAMTAIQNVGLALFPLVIAFIYKGSGDEYIPNVDYFFVICALMGVLIGIVLNVLDRKRGGILNRTEF